MQMPREIGPFHIIGIGGIGMSAIAEVMHNRGYEVQGSDLKDSANVLRLRAMGIDCMVGHHPENIAGAEFIVASTAVKPTNPEIMEARSKGVPILTRAEMLAELMRECSTVSVTGTHGKTTTTSLIAEVLHAADLDPTVLSGGIINSFGSNARIGAGQWMVVEADESDGTFIKLPTQIGVVTNIDPEHMDYWQSLDALHAAFRAFLSEHSVLRRDHRRARSSDRARDDRISGARRIGPPGADLWRCGRRRSAPLQFRCPGRRSRLSMPSWAPVCGAVRALLKAIRLPVPGGYNALNALAATAVAVEIGIGDDRIRQALAGLRRGSSGAS